MPTWDNDGTVTIAGGGGGTITFTQLEPVDLVGFGTVNVNFPNAADVVGIANGTLAAQPNITEAALVISGTSGSSPAVPFESLHLRNNTTVNIDTLAGGSDGADVITIASADNAHGNANLSINTDGSTDRLNLNGNVSLDGNFTLCGRRERGAGGLGHDRHRARQQQRRRQRGLRRGDGFGKCGRLGPDDQYLDGLRGCRNGGNVNLACSATLRPAPRLSTT